MPSGEEEGSQGSMEIIDMFEVIDADDVELLQVRLRYKLAMIGAKWLQADFCHMHSHPDATAAY
jgi:hypothetical protein